MIEILYVSIVCILLVWFRILQNLQGVSYPFIGISCIYGIWMLMNGNMIFDGVVIAIITLMLWMICSLLWTEKPYAYMEIITWLAYFILFIAVRQVPPTIIMLILIPNTMILSIYQLYKQIIKKQKEPILIFPMFGNSNWNSSFMLIGFYATIWVATNVSILFYILSIIIGIAIIMTKCRGATLGLIISLFILNLFLRNNFIIIILIGSIIFAIMNGKRFYAMLKGKLISDRWNIIKDAVKRIHPKWLIGRGMNYFRDTTYGRVHNDHLEIIGEIGIIGYLLFLNIFIQSNLSIIIVCALISIFIAGMFFYPFREVPIIVTFWAMVGSTSSITEPNFWILKITSILCLISILLFIFTIYSNLLNKLFGKKNV